MSVQKVKVIVSKMPKKAQECPFAIESHYGSKNSEIKPLLVCDFKRYKDIDSSQGISFSFTEDYHTCSLCSEKECPFLMAVIS